MENMQMMSANSHSKEEEKPNEESSDDDDSNFNDEDLKAMIQTMKVQKLI